MLTCGEEGEGDEEAVADEKSTLDSILFFFRGATSMIHTGGFKV